MLLMLFISDRYAVLGQGNAVDACVVHAFGGLAEESLLHIKLLDHKHGNGLERCHDTFAVVGRSREERDLVRIQFRIHLVQCKNVFHIALVVLEHERKVVQVHPVILKILPQVL